MAEESNAQSRAQDGPSGSKTNVQAEGDRRLLTLHETTLREGMQAPSVSFSTSDKIEIAHLLDELGLPQIQVGYGAEDRDALRSMKADGIRAKLSVLVPAFRHDWKERMTIASDAGADVILVLFRASDKQLELLGRSREQACDELATAVGWAADLGGPDVAGNASFATMADPGFVAQLLRSAADAGASRVGIADSNGVATPSIMGDLVKQVRAQVGSAEISVHTHNDFGLAVANAIEGWRSGATIADVSVLGLGERAGNAPTEQLAVTLHLLYGVDTGIRLEKISDVVTRVAQIANVQIPSWQPIVGSDVFAQKLEMHVQVTATHPELHEPFDPSLVGSARALRLGHGSGTVAVKAKLAELGVDAGEITTDEMVAWVNDEAMRSKAVVNDADFAHWVTARAKVLASGDTYVDGGQSD